MNTIIAGHFQLQEDTERARAALLAAGFPEADISAFFINPPGQHDMLALGGDRDKSPGARETGTSVAKGVATGGAVGAVIGAVSAPVTGPLGAIDVLRQQGAHHIEEAQGTIADGD